MCESSLKRNSYCGNFKLQASNTFKRTSPSTQSDCGSSQVKAKVMAYTAADCHCGLTSACSHRPRPLIISHHAPHRVPSHHSRLKQRLWCGAALGATEHYCESNAEDLCQLLFRYMREWCPVHRGLSQEPCPAPAAAQFSLSIRL